MMEYTVTLPNGAKFCCKPTQRMTSVRTLAPGTLFVYHEQIWEKVPDSAVCLSDLDNEGDVWGNIVVTVCEVSVTEKQYAERRAAGRLLAR